MKLIDLTGQRFGSLTVLEKDTGFEGKATKWICRCDCGEKLSVYADNLRRGLTNRCSACREKRRAKDLTGQRFGRLLVSQRTGTKNGAALWLCKCDCGGEIRTISSSLTNGSTKSCGCLQKEKASEQGRKSATHNQSKTRLYKIWRGMKTRTHNPKCSKYPCYGGRGIKICEEWDNSFETFREWALSSGYKPESRYGECTIDRINVNGNYEPSNCRWVDMKIQANNKRKKVQ